MNAQACKHFGNSKVYLQIGICAWRLVQSLWILHASSGLDLPMIVTRSFISTFIVDFKLKTKIFSLFILSTPKHYHIILFMQKNPIFNHIYYISTKGKNCNQALNCKAIAKIVRTFLRTDFTPLYSVSKCIQFQQIKWRLKRRNKKHVAIRVMDYFDSYRYLILWFWDQMDTLVHDSCVR